MGPRRLVAPRSGAQRQAVEEAPAIRDVHVRLVKLSMCGHFAVITADFEPLPADGELLFEFVLELPEDRLPLELAEAFESWPVPTRRHAMTTWKPPGCA